MIEVVSGTVFDVQSYSSFIPWCSVEVLKKNQPAQDHISTLVEIKLPIASYKFPCAVEKKITNDKVIISFSGSKYFVFNFAGRWEISPHGKNHTLVNFSLHLRALPILQNAIKPLVQKYTEEIIGCFEARLNKITPNKKDLPQKS